MHVPEGEAKRRK